MPYSFADTFTGVPGLPLALHNGAWNVWNGALQLDGTGTMLATAAGAAGNQAYATAAPPPPIPLWGVPEATQMEVWNDTVECGVGIRYLTVGAPPNNFRGYFATWLNGTITLWRNIPGPGRTNLATFGAGAAVGQTLRLEATGALLTVFLDGAPVIGPIADGTFPNGPFTAVLGGVAGGFGRNYRYEQNWLVRFADDFTGTPGTALATYNPLWQTDQGTHFLDNATGTAVEAGSSGSLSQLLALSPILTLDYAAEMDILDDTDASGTGVGVRYTWVGGGADFFTGYMALWVSGVITLWRYNGNGSRTSLGTATIARGANHNYLRLAAIGDQLAVYVNGVLAIGPVTDATYATGAPAIRGGAGGVAFGDHFTASQYVPSLLPTNPVIIDQVVNTPPPPLGDPLVCPGIGRPQLGVGGGRSTPGCVGLSGTAFGGSDIAPTPLPIDTGRGIPGCPNAAPVFGTPGASSAILDRAFAMAQLAAGIGAASSGRTGRPRGSQPAGRQPGIPDPAARGRGL